MFEVNERVKVVNDFLGGNKSVLHESEGTVELLTEDGRYFVKLDNYETPMGFFAGELETM